MSLISYIKYIDSLVGKPFTQLNALFYIYKSMIYFYYYRLFRTFYSSAFKDNLNYKSIAKDLESNGFAKLYNVIPLSSINKIKYFLDYSILNKNNLNSTDPESSHPYLFVLQPQLYENEILDVALSDLIIGISSCYLKSKPSLTGFNLIGSVTGSATTVTTNVPTTPVSGSIYFNTSTGYLYIYNGTRYKSSSFS
jgi:hypothetical protein